MDGKSSSSVADSSQITGGQMQSPRLTVSVSNGDNNSNPDAGITPKHTNAGDIGENGVAMPGSNGDTNLNGETAANPPIMKTSNSNNNDNSTSNRKLNCRPGLLKTTSSFTKRSSVNKSSRKIHFSDQVGGKLEENVFCSSLHYSNHEIVRTNEVANTSCCTIS